MKGVLEDNFVDFLRFIYPNADEIFDFSKGIIFMDKELLEIMPDRVEKKGGRIADLLVKVYLLDGTERWILLHTEIEGGNDIQFSFRMFQYNYRIFDRYKVFVESIAVFTGDRNQRRPDEYFQEGISTSYHFRYRTYHIFDHEADELLLMDNIFAYIVLACQQALLEGKVPETKLAEERSTIARALIKTGKYDKRRIISFLVFLKSIIFIDDEDIDNQFDSFIYHVTGGTINMGVVEVVKKQEREKGRIEGRVEGREEERVRAEAEKRAIVCGLINETAFSNEEIARFAKVSLLLVEELRKELKK